MIRGLVRVVLAALCTVAMALGGALVAGAPAASASQVYGFGLDAPLGTSVSSVSCASASFCVAVGGAYAYAWDGSTWSSAALDNGHSLKAVDCISSSFCMAVDNAGYAKYYNGSSWNPARTFADSNGGISVSCTSSTDCVAGTPNGPTYHWSGGLWSSGTSFNAGDYVSCVSTGDCFGGDAAGQMWSSTNGGTSFSTISSPPGTAGNAFAGISCLTSTFCAATAYKAVMVGAPGAMTATTLASGSASMGPVSCASASFCLAADIAGNYYTYDGTSWSAGSSVLGSAALNSISCPTSSFCMATDTAGQVLTYGPVAFSFSAPTAPVAVPGAPYGFSLQASGGDTPYTYSASGLPSWLSLDTTTGAISGVVPQGATSVSNVSVAANDAATGSGSGNFSIPVTASNAGWIAPLVDARATNGTAVDGTPAPAALSGLGDVVAGPNGWYVADGTTDSVDFVPNASGTYFGQAMTAGAVYIIAGGPSASGPVPGPALGANLTPGGAPGWIAVGADGYVVATAYDAWFAPFTAGTYFGQAMTAGDIYLIDSALPEIGAVALDAAGNAYFAGTNEVVEIPNTSGSAFGQTLTAGTQVVIAGTGTYGNPTSGAAATSTDLAYPAGLAVDASGDLYIANGDDGIISLLPAASGTHSGQAMTAGDLYNVVPATTTGTTYLTGLTIDPFGNLYYADGNANTVKMVPAASCSSACPWGLASATAGTPVVIAGGGATAPTAAEVGTSASISPIALSYDAGTGELAVSEYYRGDLVFGGPVATAPSFTSPMTARCTVDVACTVTVTTSGSPTAALTESGTLPSGLAFVDNGDGTATLSGTASATASATLVLTAANIAGSAQQSLALTVASAPSRSAPTSTSTTAPATPTAIPSPTLPSGYGNPVVGVVGTGTPTPVVASVGAGLTAAVSVGAGTLPDGTAVAVAVPVGRVSPADAIPALLGQASTFAVSWKAPNGSAPTVTKPVIVTIDGHSLHVGDIVYAETSSGPKVIGVVDINGTFQVSTTTAESAYVVAVPPRTSAPSSVARRSATAAGVHLACTQGAICEGSATLSVARRTAHGVEHVAVATAHPHVVVGHDPVVRFALTPFGEALARAHHGGGFDVTMLMRTQLGNRLVQRIHLG